METRNESKAVKRLTIGFDVGTQGIKAIALDEDLQDAGTWHVDYDHELPAYGTRGGVHTCESKPGIATAPTAMFINAMQLTLDRMLEAGFPFEQVVAISGSCQQHGSVYWGQGGLKRLKGLVPSQCIVKQLRGLFTRENAPIWMDSSTTVQCKEIEDKLGGAKEVARRTGSRCFERFMGPQVRKFWQQEPNMYEKTESIQLLSTCMCSILLGEEAPTDFSDAGGTNLFNLANKEWDNTMAEAIAPGVISKLGPLVPAHSLVGNVAPYFCERYGFNMNCKCVCWSGDNPNSLAGLALSKCADVAVSLGTSDTLFGIVQQIRPHEHVWNFVNPVDPDTTVCMLVYKNGAFVRDNFRIRCCGENSSWEDFGNMLKAAPIGCNGNMGFFYDKPEILPAIKAGYYRFSSNNKPSEPFENNLEVRALIEGQCLAFKQHADEAGISVARVFATGGASENDDILQVLSDVFNCPVTAQQQKDSAPHGAALRAAHGLACAEVFQPFNEWLELHRSKGCGPCTRQVLPSKNKVTMDTYRTLVERRKDLESLLPRL